MANEKMRKAVFLKLTTNKSQKAIATEINVAQKTISEWKKTDEWKEHQHNLTKEYFGELAMEATKTLKKLLTSKSDHVRLEAAKDLLDRAGFKATDKVDITERRTVIVDDVPETDD